MKFFAYAFLCIVIVLTISCKKNTNNSKNEYPKVISKAAINTDNNETSKQNIQISDSTIKPKINIGNNYSIIYIRNINLDFDIEDEQVIAAIDKEGKQNLKIMVLDFDSVRNKYIMTWEIEKTNINYRTISISYMDIVGDHSLEIIFNAVSLDNKQVLDVFRKTHSPSGISLYYESICSLEVNGEIEIQEKERSQAYLLGQKNGASFPIITYEDIKTEKEQQPAVRKTSYMWNYQASKYINAFEETVSAKVIEEQKINKMFFDDIESYKTFLEGQWYNVESDNFIIRFNGSANEIAFYTSDLLEIYKWSNATYSRLNKTIDINARNDQIHFITKRIIIKIENMNRIRIDIKDRENPKDVDHQMDGYYTRISESIMPTMYSEKKSNSGNIVLNGEFLGTNDAIIFEDYNFILKSDNSVKKGVFSIYNYNSDDIIELRFIDGNRIVKEVKLYKINMDSQTMENSVINRIILTKGIVTTNAFSPSGEDLLYYVQTAGKEE